MRKFSFAVGLGLSLVLAPAQAKVQFRWFIAMGNGGVQVAGIRNEAGTYFRISCVPEGTIGEGASLQFDRSGVKSASQPSAIQVVIDGEAFLFELDQSGLTNLTPREQRSELTRLSSRLSTSKSDNFMVEIPNEDKVEVFSLKDAQKAIGKAPRTIVGACR